MLRGISTQNRETSLTISHIFLLWKERIRRNLASSCRPDGEIGRRARLRIWFRKECGFKSLFGHFLNEGDLAGAELPSLFGYRILLPMTVAHSDESVSVSQARDDAFWRAHNGVALVWSNPRASDSVMIAKALLAPRFHQLLEIAAHFGLERLKLEWRALCDELGDSPWPEQRRAIDLAEPVVSRCLHHMEEGLRNVAA